MKLCPKCGTEQVFNAGHNPGGMQCLQVQLHDAERERDDARTELDELRGMFDTLEQRRVSDAKQLAAQAPVIEAAKELIRVWGDGERYGGEMMELECAVLDLDEAEKGDRHEIE